MKAATFVFLLAVCGTVMRGQTKAPSGDVTINMSEGAPVYCAGPTTPTPVLQAYMVFKIAKLGRYDASAAAETALRKPPGNCMETLVARSRVGDWH
jgi:hypothetical protein